MAFDGALFDEGLPGEAANVAFHLRIVALVSKSREMESDIRSFTRQALVEQRTIEGHPSYSTKVLTLTKDGHRLLERAQLVSSRQATYHGLVKPKEARPDPDLSRVSQQAAESATRTPGRATG